MLATVNASLPIRELAVIFANMLEDAMEVQHDQDPEQPLGEAGLHLYTSVDNGEVRYHQESTERQYALKQRAIDLGWKEVRVLDGDLGISGAQMAGRNDFKTLVTDVSMRKAGAVFALEASRLARVDASAENYEEIMKKAGLEKLGSQTLTGGVASVISGTKKC